jgi:hypothetical protein
MIDYDATVYEEEGKLVVWEGILVIAHTEAPDETTLPLIAGIPVAGSCTSSRHCLGSC